MSQRLRDEHERHLALLAFLSDERQVHRRPLSRSVA